MPDESLPASPAYECGLRLYSLSVANLLRVGLILAIDPMIIGSVESLILSLPIGIISGGYSSLVVTKYARFSELRREALRAIRSINFIGDDAGVSVSGTDTLSSLQLIASDMFALGHKSAGKTINSLFDLILGANMLAEQGKISAPQYGEQFSDWQSQARGVSPNRKIYLPWGWP